MRISKKEFDTAVKRWKDTKNRPDTNFVTYGCEDLQLLLAVPGCVEVRTYYGINDENQLMVYFVPCDKDHNPIWNTDGSSMESTSIEESTIINRGQPCPPICPGGGGG